MAEQRKTDEKRYDRQLRLWGEEGQAALEDARICLLNATATGTETLKNLILPGVGHFTIIDGHKVTEADRGNNFFVAPDTIGKSRAAVTYELLQELNSLSKGDFIEQDPVALIEKDASFFTKYTHIIATNIPEVPLRKLAKVCWDHNIPLVIERVYGFIGYMRVVTPEHTIVESKPDNPPDDLRLLEPFPELVQYASSFDFQKMDSTEHSHTPFIIILLQYLAKWKADHGKYPEVRAEKEAFRNLVIRGSRNAQEENFAEAYRSANKYLNAHTIPSATRAVLADPKAANITADSAKFWIMANALKGFVDNEGKGGLPLMGSIPDMTASTQTYIGLQKIYQDKATADAAAVDARVKATLAKIGKPENFISAEEVKKFCKNSMFLQVIRYRSLEEELTASTAKASTIASELDNSYATSNGIFFYVVFRAIDRFYTKHNRLPGAADSQVQSDFPLLRALVDEVLAEFKIDSTKVADKYIQEMIRFGGAELHPIGALFGGVASQEVIKIITHQYTSLNNTFLFNGMDSTSISYEL